MANSKFSSFVFTVIDMAGINDGIKRKRIEYQKNKEWYINECAKDLGRFEFQICTGSTSEGTFPFSLSDSDTMTVMNDPICLDKSNFDGVDINTTFNILVAESENIAPGYVNVAAEYIQINNPSTMFSKEMFSLGSYWYGSSTNSAPYISHKFVKQLKNKRINTLPSMRIGSEVYTFTLQGEKKNGPAFTRNGRFIVNNGLTSSELHLFEYDFVLAIPYYNSNILTEWSSRSRSYDWPSDEKIKDVSTMEAFIIPIGEKKSESEHVEWRISHVTSEKLLIQSFNSTQYKLYVVLKLFSKQVFTSVSKSFSSYMVKNVVLWMAEANPMHHFTPDRFIDCILQSFNFIKNCLTCNHLPSYIMPKKNLIAGRIVGHEKRELIVLLSCLLEEGACFIYRVPKLAECLNYASIRPDVFSSFCIWRHCVETQSLLLKSATFSGFDFKYFKQHLFHNQPFDIERLMAHQEEQVPNGTDILIILLIPDVLKKLPRVNVSEMTRVLHKRLDIVNKCFFLKNE